MKKSICIFEDEGIINLLPLVYTRPVFDLRCGILTLEEKIAHYFKSSKIILHTRKFLEDVIKERNSKYTVNNLGSEDILFINGRLIINQAVYRQINKMEINSILLGNDGSVVAANIPADKINSPVNPDDDLLLFNELMGLNKIESDIKLVKYPWDLVNANGSEIENDFKLLVKKPAAIKQVKFPAVQFKNKKQIYFSKDAVIDPFVFIDASGGPVFIGKKAHVMSHSFIQGPAFIGDETIIKSHAAIYHNTSIGKLCKVGGEVEASVIHSFSNKQHEGFLGHSYLGSWINIGASTNSSDLKNNYGNITVMLNGKPTDTNSRFVGLIMGDHSKTAINTMFNTGTVVGVSCNLFGAGFPARYIPSFSWGGSDFIRTYDINKCLEAAKIVMSRRKIELSGAEEKLLRTLFDLTSNDRTFKVKQ